MKIGEIMTLDPICCSLEDTAEQAASLMQELDVGVLPVVESDKCFKVVGIVTDRDLCLKVVAEGRDARQVRVLECMTPAVICCHRDDQVQAVIELMQTYKVRRLPVVDQENRIEGIISTADLALRTGEGILAATMFEETIKQISYPLADGPFCPLLSGTAQWAHAESSARSA
jgi:CBS domain-containing protein